MPPPYPLLDMPPGKFSNMFDYPAINMAAAHNIFIQGANAIVAHAPHITDEKVQPFMIFCLALLALINHHHHLEESYYFPAIEEKLGKGTLSGNIDEHALFVPKLKETENWMKAVQSGQEKYDSAVCLDKVNSFADIMVEHMKNEPPTLDRDKIRAVFTEQELKEIDAEFMRRALSNVDFYTLLPVMACCGNPATPWFPPIPLPLKWATRWWFSWWYQAAWEFGPLDFYGNTRSLSFELGTFEISTPTIERFYLILTPQSSTYASPQFFPEVGLLSSASLVNLSTKDCNPQDQKSILEAHSLSTSHPPSPLIPATKSLERAFDLAEELSQTENLPLDRIYIAEICPGLVASNTVHYSHWLDLVHVGTDFAQNFQEYGFVGHIPASAVRFFETVKECQGLQIESDLAGLIRNVELPDRLKINTMPGTRHKMRRQIMEDIDGAGPRFYPPRQYTKFSYRTLKLELNEHGLLDSQYEPSTVRALYFGGDFPKRSTDLKNEMVAIMKVSWSRHGNQAPIKTSSENDPNKDGASFNLLLQAYATFPIPWWIFVTNLNEFDPG
ncbi:hypothetical protein GALMADRAFT_1344375 [Galerina marginata CBS 339.88]|uniref:Hemerythrin-like domain-containing protein n=1 Tax=Galerina marginata (strain CBS 339.88) TaxID=685588 RepID=A0A067SWR9_GALM3|nr:hypothetical protein GALMADRAFT_1344375 [Galerina marginata CBS 339.88]